MENPESRNEQTRTSSMPSREERESLFRTIFVSSPLGIKLLDEEGYIIRTNRAFEMFLEYPQEDLRGSHFSQFTHPADRRHAEERFQGLISGSARRYRLEKRYLTSSGRETWANLSLTSVRGADGELQFILAMVEDITARKRMALDLAEIRSRLLDSAELERLKLAQELHDGPMQDLHSVNYQLQALRGQAGEETSRAIDAIDGTVRKVLETLRSAAQTLRPPAIDDFGLSTALESHVDELQERHPETKFELALTDDLGLLPRRHRLGLFRIFQQAVMNAIVHGQAGRIRVRFMLDPEEIVLEVEDDGSGFEVPDNWVGLVREGHFGLAGAAERATAMGGRLDVHSHPGEGARLRVVIPFELDQGKTDG